MDEYLVEELRSRNLYPLDLDSLAQDAVMRLGINPSDMETHYSPGTPARTIERYERIEADVRRLHEMDLLGINNTDVEYETIEERIKANLFELTFPTIEDIMSKYPPTTGTCGVNRDIIAFLPPK
jgi:hypothetical protein